MDNENHCIKHRCNFNCDEVCFAEEPSCMKYEDTILVIDNSPSIKDVLEVVCEMDEETVEVQS